jgi:probable O-glycosylation ligase (exosortase A-associated)
VVVAVIAGSFGFHAAKAGLASILGGGVRFFEGPGGAFTDNNGYAVGMAMIIPLIVVSAQVAGNRWIKWGFYTAVPLAAVAVVGTFSRGGFLALVAAGLTLVLLKRRIAALCMVVLVAAPLWWFAGTQEGYVERLSTIQTYDEVGEASALSRLHFWAVAVRMAQANVLGVGLFNYERAYDQYDFLDGAYGRRRSVHSSPFQVLAETGFMGAAVFGFLFVYGFICTRRVRRRAKNKELSESDRALLVGASDALVASMVGFLVGGSFIAMALNDLTWFTFALIATLDRISATLTLPSPSAVVVPRASQRVAGWPGARPSVQWRQHERG